MDSLEQYRQLVQEVIIEHTKIPYANGEVQFETVFDKEQDRYLLMLVGREPAYGLALTSTRRVHGCLIHIDIIEGKIWIQRDGTEEGVASHLLRAGIARDKIVLGFRSEELRQCSELASV
jgi:hypothetical protein